MTRRTRPHQTRNTLGSESAPIRRRVGAVALAAGLVAAGCTSGGDGPEGAPDPDGPTETVELGNIDLVGALARYDSCEAFLDDVKTEALERVGPYGFGQSGWGLARGGFTMTDDADMGMEQASGVDSAAPATTMPSQGLVGDQGSAGNFSGTNNQEGGVDEPDLVKTDGEILAVVDQDQLRILDVSDPASPALVSSTPLAGHNGELLLHGDDLLVFQRVGAQWGGPIPLEDARGIGAPVATTVPSDDEPNPSGSRIAPGPWWPNQEVTTVAHVDISDPADPQTQRTWTVEGGYVSARLVDGVARVVLRSDPSASLPFVYPSGQNAEDAAETANRAVIEASTIEDWVPELTISDGDGDVLDESVLVPCDQMYRPSAFAGFGVVGVLTADVAGDGLADGMGVGVLSSGETVYASPTSLFVATNQWIEPDTQAGDTTASDEIMPAPPMGSQRTDVHQFATEGASPAQYLASGSIDGRILNQFSMSEHDDHLRIAVTDGQWSEASASSVVVLARRGESLDEVGRVGDLGKGEQIYAVRFMGERGYVVTFRQIDPLYTLDLADPANPQLLGELKIPGFSSYLHPVGDGLLAGVGQDATDEGMVTGSQISLFDVSDPANPERVAQLDLGEGSNSEVEHDHRAFLFWEGLAVLPYTSYQWDEQSESVNTGAIGVDIDASARTLVERGRISHAEHPSGAIGEPSPNSPDHWERQYGSVIRRSVVIDDTLLTISDRGVLASSLASFEPGSWVNFGG